MVLKNRAFLDEAVLSDGIYQLFRGTYCIRVSCTEEKT